MRFNLLLLFLTIGAVMNTSTVNAQAVEKPITCELTSSYLDYILDKASEKDLLIVIARLGKNENQVDLNRRRLFNLNAYLTKYKSDSVFSRNPRNIILATGDKSDGFGVLEIYFKGNLFEKFHLSQNQDLYIGECAVDLEFFKSPCEINSQKIFYPCLGDSKKP